MSKDPYNFDFLTLGDDAYFAAARCYHAYGAKLVNARSNTGSVAHSSARARFASVKASFQPAGTTDPHSSFACFLSPEFITVAEVRASLGLIR